MMASRIVIEWDAVLSVTEMQWTEGSSMKRKHSQISVPAIKQLIKMNIIDNDSEEKTKATPGKNGPSVLALPRRSGRVALSYVRSIRA